ncbi:MAG: glutamine-hydrolyzing carbamoyl-phosphate synthase small subunit [Opitutales bacterium]
MEDGSVFRGRGFGASAVRAVGEAVFNTSMTGYQEILTDPSYLGQIVTMTAPQIGNYGVNPEDVESDGPKVTGFVVRDLSPIASNWRSTESLHEYLLRYGIPGVTGVDTRTIAKKLRVTGVQKACICTEDISDEEAVRRAREWPGLEGVDYVKEVSCKEIYEFDPAKTPGGKPFEVEGTKLADYPRDVPRKHCVAYDLGAKYNTFRKLWRVGFDVTVVPADTPASVVRGLKPDAIFLSNGPGDPAPLTYVHEAVRDLMQDFPMFGICMGNHMLTHALGADTFKLKFGHRGANHPVKNLETGHVYITSQNHGFAAKPEDVVARGGIVTELNMNDGTVSGIRIKGKPVFAVQYHPEASPGPHESGVHFETFYNSVRGV